MKKIELTNQVTRVFFSQYGQTKMLTYQGTEKDAKQYLKSALGVKRTTYSYSQELDCFLPKGYNSLEIKD